jgi:hypothetical protein
MRGELVQSGVLINALLHQLICNRQNISDQSLIVFLKTLALVVRDSSASKQEPHSQAITLKILGYPQAVNSLFELLKYPHKGIKIHVSSLLASLRLNIARLIEDESISENDSYVKY